MTGGLWQETSQKASVPTAARSSCSTLSGQSARVIGQRPHSEELGTLTGETGAASLPMREAMRSMKRASMAEAGISTAWSLYATHPSKAMPLYCGRARGTAH